ncbi:MAG: hypothetical protein J3K34DRAFT_409080 [Monoraphidium minutum]|nr:MAG: hypothetical protein J3K34DRAFT_409080 [Monoraphidium minutum]
MQAAHRPAVQRFSTRQQKHGCAYVRRPCVVRRAAAEDTGPPPGCARYTVELRKPLGIVLEQKGTSGGIFVVSITPDSNAFKTGQMTVGDQLISTSGVTYNRTEDYGGVNVRMGQQVVTLNCTSESFKTVSAAIGSHPSGMAVRLTFQRCDPNVTT